MHMFCREGRTLAILTLQAPFEVNAKKAGGSEKSRTQGWHGLWTPTFGTERASGLARTDCQGS
jgi:hypothetical protein